MSSDDQDQRDPRVKELLKKLRIETKNANTKAQDTKKELDKVIAHATGALLFSQVNTGLTSIRESLQRAFLACDMAMVVSTSQIIVAGYELQANPEDEENRTVKEQAHVLFRQAAKLQKSLVPFGMLEAEFNLKAEAFDRQQLQQYMEKLEGMWPLLDQAEDMYDAAVAWRNAWAENLNGLQGTKNV